MTEIDGVSEDFPDAVMATRGLRKRRKTEEKIKEKGKEKKKKKRRKRKEKEKTKRKEERKRRLCILWQLKSAKITKSVDSSIRGVVINNLEN